MMAPSFIHQSCLLVVLEPLDSIPGMAEADLASSSFSQRDLQPGSPEVMCKMSDPDSADRKRLTA